MPDSAISATTLQQILRHRIVAILRGCDPAHVLSIAEALYAGGIRLLEITLNSSDAFSVIEQLCATLGDRMVIGAGTVLEAAEATSAVAAGARFIISPSLDPQTIRRTLDLGAVSIPGAYTATEVLAAHRLGGQLIKVFPAQSPAYIRDLRGPLSKIPLMPTGGIRLDNIRAFQNEGAAAFGVGSALVLPTDALASPSGEPTPDYLQGLTANAAAFVNAIKSSSP
jgi:2-dehydro-3-deoxyphosphogluconate aldolase/(4S)-4-hydroxy-2-oxoglutarate aldolase